MSAQAARRVTGRGVEPLRGTGRGRSVLSARGSRRSTTRKSAGSISRTVRSTHAPSSPTTSLHHAPRTPQARRPARTQRRPRCVGLSRPSGAEPGPLPTLATRSASSESRPRRMGYPRRTQPMSSASRGTAPSGAIAFGATGARQRNHESCRRCSRLLNRCTAPACPHAPGDVTDRPSSIGLLRRATSNLTSASRVPVPSGAISADTKAGTFIVRASSIVVMSRHHSRPAAASSGQSVPATISARECARTSKTPVSRMSWVISVRRYRRALRTRPNRTP